MAGELDALTTAAVRAWAAAARAWIEAVSTMWFGWIDLAAAETNRNAFNEEVILVPPQPAATALHPGPFTDIDGNQLLADSIDVLPQQVGPGAETELRVRVRPPPGTASGTYSGSLCDAPGGNPVVDEVGVYVVGDRMP